jgi:DNA-binding MarR family transcriptional regulator
MLDDLARAPAYRLARVARLLRHDLQRLLDAHGGGISQEQYFLLYRLARQDGQPQRALTDPAFDDRANITRLVDGLVDRGLVERRSDPEDGRRSLVTLTSEGRARIEGLLPHVQAERERLWSALSEAEMDTLLGLLDRIERRLG